MEVNAYVKIYANAQRVISAYAVNSQNVLFLVCMVANVKGITCANVKKDLEAIIVKLMNTFHARLVTRHVEMEFVNQITHVSVILVGLEGHVTKIRRWSRN